MEPWVAGPNTQLPTQREVLDWVRSQWPDSTSLLWRALKLGEEVGEVQEAVVKMSEEPPRKSAIDLAQETAQLTLCAMALAEAAGFDLQSEICAEWAREHR